MTASHGQTSGSPPAKPGDYLIYSPNRGGVLPGAAPDCSLRYRNGESSLTATPDPLAAIFAYRVFDLRDRFPEPWKHFARSWHACRGDRFLDNYRASGCTTCSLLRRRRGEDWRAMARTPQEPRTRGPEEAALNESTFLTGITGKRCRHCQVQHAARATFFYGNGPPKSLRLRLWHPD